MWKVKRCKGEKNRLDLNKKSIFLAADFAREEMCSFQDRLDATETPNMDRLSHIFKAFETKRISGGFLFLLLEIKQHRSSKKAKVSSRGWRLASLMYIDYY